MTRTLYVVPRSLSFLEGLLQEARHLSFTGSPVSEKTSSETVRKVLNTDQPPHHESSHRRIDEGLAGVAQPLVILTHPPVVALPRECPLYHPTPWHDLKTLTREQLLPVNLPALLGPFLCPDPSSLLRD
jgi:hypothetical protein